MTRPVDPALARNLADRIERLPDLINDPLRMPFVQDTLRVALEQYRSDREVHALGREILGDPGEAEEHRQPVAFVQLLDDEKRVIEEGFNQDETGVFEQIERDAAEIGEWLKECRHPRDAERFRESLKFVRSDMVVWPVLGVEVRPGVYKLDLSIWETEVAKPMCNYLRGLADEMADDPSAYAMSFDGAHWHIRYDSERGFVNDSKGAAYVAQLLEQRGKTIPCHMLHRSTEHSLTKNDPTISRDDAAAELAVLRDELAELRRRMEEKPHEVLPEDREGMQHILDRIQQLTGLGGRPRQKGDADAARTAVLNAVKRFYRACREKKLDSFVNHLESKLDLGSNPVYRGSIEWKISRVTPDVTM